MDKRLSPHRFLGPFLQTNGRAASHLSNIFAIQSGAMGCYGELFNPNCHEHAVAAPSLPFLSSHLAPALLFNPIKVAGILKEDSPIFPGIDTLRKICNHPDLAVTVCDSPDYSDPTVPLPWQRSGKMVVLHQLLALWFSHGHRVLVFCQTRQMLDLIEAFVRAEVCLLISVSTLSLQCTGCSPTSACSARWRQ